VNRLRVAVVADFLEEGWPSMDLVADMLVERLQREHAGDVAATLIRPSMRRRAAAVPGAARLPSSLTVDRFVNRLWDYPRIVAGLSARYSVFHVVDHSYAHLVHRLPAGRTLVTCHDLDTFRSVLDRERERRSAPFRAMTRHVLDGLRRAAHVACDSAATRDALVERASIEAERTTVVYNGPHPSCTPAAEPIADAEAGRLLGRVDHSMTVLLHVGSAIARKRIDVLVRVLAAVRTTHPDARLIRVGGPLTAAQRALASELGVADAIAALPFLDRATLAAVYRRSALLLLPSDREGFGLPVLEAMACGTPVVASDIDPLREVGGTAVTYCPVGDVESWRTAVVELLDERLRRPDQWRARRDAGLARATAFSWSRYAREIVGLYHRLGPATRAGSA
jgi:glycosyltransferase involved in cell wall biosynthesis